MLYDLYKREVERRTARRTWEEAERLTQEWKELSPEEQERHGVTEYVRSRRSIADFLDHSWKQSDEERKIRREDWKARHENPNLFRLLYLPFGYIPYFGSE